MIFELSANASHLLVGKLQFPKTIKTVPFLPLWCSGFLLKREVDHKTKELIFQVPQYQQQTSFYFLVTETVKPAKLNASTLQNNLVYLSIPEHTPYKLYYFESKKPGKESYWTIEEHLLHHPDQRIPDNTIILLYRPDAIAKIEGGSQFELPTITFINHLVTLFGSEKEMASYTDLCAAASISINTFHSFFPQSIKFDKNRTLVAS